MLGIRPATQPSGTRNPNRTWWNFLAEVLAEMLAGRYITHFYTWADSGVLPSPHGDAGIVSDTGDAAGECWKAAQSRFFLKKVQQQA